MALAAHVINMLIKMEHVFWTPIRNPILMGR